MRRKPRLQKRFQRDGARLSGPTGNQRVVRLPIFTRCNMTGTSASTPTIVASTTGEAARKSERRTINIYFNVNSNTCPNVFFSKTIQTYALYLPAFGTSPRYPPWPDQEGHNADKSSCLLPTIFPSASTTTILAFPSKTDCSVAPSAVSIFFIISTVIAKVIFPPKR